MDEREKQSKNWRLQAAASSAIQDGLTPDEVREVVEAGIAEATASAGKVADAKARADEIMAQYRSRVA